MRRTSRAWLAAAALAACGHGSSSKTPSGPPVPLPPAAPPPLVLPDIPTTITTKAIEPMTDDTPAERSPLLDIMSGENARWMKTLSAQPDPGYYLAYQITDQRLVVMEAEGGALVTDSDEADRNLDVEVRVGAAELDNSHQLSDDNGLNAPLSRHGAVPIGDDKGAVARHIWVETDRRYREAVQALAYVRQDQSTLKKHSTAPDFTSAPKEIYIGKVAKLEFDKAAWVARLKRCSERAYKGVVTRGTCRAEFSLNTMYMVNSEGSQIQQSWTNAQLSVSVGVKTDDGMNLNRLEQRFGVTPADLPADADDKMIEVATKDLEALHEAPLGDPYVGPAILEGRAAGVFFHEVFGHRIEGHRQKDLTSGQTFASYVG